VKLVIAAVGTRMPDWVEAGVAEYVKRMPRELPVSVIAVKAEPRVEGKSAAAMMAQEAARLRAAMPARSKCIALDERGAELTTRSLADRLRGWMTEGDDVTFLIGGPDGLDEQLKHDAHERVRLSGLTLPHALVRVILAEALYRAASLLRGHPYHRE
jgi:23S rRNA (pseudouridine1915-N3)-methyltransferase